MRLAVIDGAAEIETGSLKRAIEIATEAHLGHLDKAKRALHSPLNARHGPG
jgi:hypothetical protein